MFWNVAGAFLSSNGLRKYSVLKSIVGASGFDGNLT